MDYESSAIAKGNDLKCEPLKDFCFYCGFGNSSIYSDC